MSRDDDRDTCMAHIEFQRRIDDRWRDHIDAHKNKEDEICTQLRELRKELGDVKNRLYWLLGGAAIVIPIMQVLVPVLLHFKK